MITRFLNYLLLLISALVLLVLVGVFLPYQLPNIKYFTCGAGYLRLKLTELEANPAYDILVLGSSHAYRGIDPRIFAEQDFRLFNLGSSNQTPQQSLVLFQYALQIHKPKLLVLELSPELMCADGSESVCDIVSATTSFALAFSAFQTEPNLLSFNTLIVASASKLVTRPMSYCQSETDNDRYIQGGFAERSSCGYSKEVLKPLQLSYSDKSIQSVKEITEQCNQLGIQCLLVQAPVTKVYLETLPAGLDFDKRMKEFGNYINFNTYALGLVDSLDFYDSNHLCQDGVKKFSRALIQEIK